MLTYSQQYLEQVRLIAAKIDLFTLEKMVQIVLDIRHNGGRLFFLGVGGGAGNASHAVNDFRKICCIESYSPCDNVSELTARTNDEGWENVFLEWLKGSHLIKADGVFVFSVGGGNLQNNVSVNLVRALEYAQTVGARILGIVGRDGGYTAQVADACLIVPTVEPQNITPHTESFQSVIWHLLVSHPQLRRVEMKWESLIKEKR
jgi:D-sedoheptulose 7-phosphate isomerase